MSTDVVTGEVLPPREELSASGAGVSRGAAIGGFAALTLVGFTAAVYGPAIPELRDDFGVSAAVAGLALSANFAGAMTGIIVSGALAHRVHLRVRLSMALVFLAGGLIGLVVSPAYPLVIVASFVMGLGAGTIDLGYSALFASGFGRRSGSFSNLLHACFGVGAVMAPLLIGALSTHGFRPLALAAGVAALGVVPLALRTHDPATVFTASMRGVRGVPWVLLGVFTLLFFIYGGTETSVGGWEPTHLQELGYSEGRASSLTSLFWAALMVGRMVSVTLSMRIAPHHLVVGASILAFGSLGIAQVEDVAPAGYALAGLGLAPIFPTALVWLVYAVPHARRATAIVIGAASMGAVAVSAIVGTAVTLVGAEWIPTLLFALAGLTCATASTLLWLTRPGVQSPVLSSVPGHAIPRRHED